MNIQYIASDEIAENILSISQYIKQVFRLFVNGDEKKIMYKYMYKNMNT